MAIPHVVSGQVVDLFQPEESLPAGQSFALFKSRELEVIRLWLPAGKRFPAHKVAGEITVQCLRGRIAFGFGSQRTELGAGQLLYLAGGVVHDLVGLEDATVLVTIVLRP